MTVGQAFAPTARLDLLCPPGDTANTHEPAKIAFGPFGASILTGFVAATIPARMDEAQDLWSLVLRDAMPEDEHRNPGGEPLPTLRTAMLGWRLLALLGGAIEVLVAASSAVSSWREAGQPTGLDCPLGPSLLSYRSQGAAQMATELARFATPAAASALFGYPSDQILRRYVSARRAGLIHARCERSAGLLADVFSLAGSVVADPFWRTFVKWKHGAVATSPGVGPLWVNDSPGLDAPELEARLATGIVVFDTQGGPNLYVWPAQRVEFVAYSTMLMQVLQVAEMVISSALNYARRQGTWPIALFEIEQDAVPNRPLRAALDALAASPYPVAALAGLWRD
jgi:hypothetical protein